MTKTSAQRWLRAKLGPEVRVIAREGHVRIVHEKDGRQTLIGSGATVEKAMASLTSAARELVATEKEPTSLEVRATARTPRQAFAIAFRAFWAALLMWLSPRRLLAKVRG